MKVFISWSGNDSKKLAETLRQWLPAVLQAVKPYFTPSDIDKGARWNTEVAKELDKSEVGILCITRDNLHSDWVMFEAGALSKSLDRAHVCPILFGIQNTDLAGPLKQFQTTQFEKEDIRKLVSLINGKLDENKLTTVVLDSVFDKWWPDLEANVNHILENLGEPDEEPVRSDRDMIQEILELSRLTSRYVRKSTPGTSTIHPGAIIDLLERYISLHDEQVAGQGGYQDTLEALRGMKEPLEYIAKRYRKRSAGMNELLERLDELTFSHEEQGPIENEDIPF